MTALQDLLAKVEAGWPPDIDTPYMTPFHAAWPDWRAQQAWLANQGSLDAAKALHDAVLPDRSCGITFGGEYGATITFPPTWDRMSISESNLIPARAWLIAVLRALIAQEEGR